MPSLIFFLDVSIETLPVDRAPKISPTHQKKFGSDLAHLRYRPLPVRPCMVGKKRWSKVKFNPFRYLKSPYFSSWRDVEIFLIYRVVTGW